MMEDFLKSLVYLLHSFFLCLNTQARILIVFIVITSSPEVKYLFEPVTSLCDLLCLLSRHFIIPEFCGTAHTWCISSDGNGDRV